jgi:hypothetical protein
LNASHDRRRISLGLGQKKKKTTNKVNELVKQTQVEGFVDDCNTGFVHYKMETEAEVRIKATSCVSL